MIYIFSHNQIVERSAKMKKLLLFITAFFLLVGITTSANALQTATSYAGVDLDIDYGTATAYGQGIVSAGLAYADSTDDSLDIGVYADSIWCDRVLDGWAYAYSSGAYSETGVSNGILYSEAYAYAGDGYGEVSVAGAENYAWVSVVKVTEETTISLNYYLSGEITGDTDYGYSEALSAAILAVYSCGTGVDASGEWLDVATGYDTDSYSDSGTLYLTLAEGIYTIFSGTAAFAYAAETNPVPEPATMLLLGTGLIGLAGVGRKKIFKK